MAANLSCLEWRARGRRLAPICFVLMAEGQFYEAGKRASCRGALEVMSLAGWRGLAEWTNGCRKISFRETQVR